MLDPRAMDDAADRRPRVVYGNDPLCGWCFAIGPQVLAARDRTADRVDWWLECGGLVVGERVRPIAADREYLRAGLASVEAVSGRRAGSAYLDGLLTRGTWVSDSEPACRAVLVARDMAPELAIDLSHGLTDALYVDGREPDSPATLLDVAGACGLDGAELVRRWSSPEAREATRVAFEHARGLGITTYPSLFVQLADGDRLVPVVTGYADADTIVDRLEALVPES